MKIIQSIIIAATALGTVSCGSGDQNQSGTQLPPVEVNTATVASIATEGSFTVSGKIEAQNSANLSTRMMGNVTQLHVNVGDQVKEGQLLVAISSADLMAKKGQVEASISQAKAVYENAKNDLDRFKSLYKKGSASEKELEGMTMQYEMAKAGLEAANQMMKEVQAQFAFTNIVAPFSGQVTNTFVKKGDIAAPGMPLLAIEGTSRFQAVAMVPETMISQIQKGAIANIVVKSSGKKLTGRVSEVSRSAKTTGGQYLIRIDLANVDKDILPGMFVNVAMSKTIAGASTAPAINERALVQNGQLTGVYTIDENNTAILRWLRLGRTTDGMVEVLSGMTPGEKYIVSSEGKLFNGAIVRVKKSL
ncbi:MAG: efflux RND transporter periplasmic adaptor subunit [Cyclobacteriaceae bacterium]